MKSLRLGFIGGALDSAVGYAHFCACRMDRVWTLEAGIFSPQPALNRRTAETYGVASSRAYSNMVQFLKKEKDRLDAVAILCPTPMHKKVVLACLRAGLPVICEKALAVSSREIREIEACRAKARGFLAVTYNYSGYPMVREMRRLIRGGRLGRILHFQAEMPQEGFVRRVGAGQKPKVQSWRLRDGFVPTIHLDLGVHLHQLIHYLTGLKPREVVASQASYGWFGVVDEVTALTRYSGGVQGAIWFSKSALGYRNGLRLRIFGSKASAEWVQGNPEELRLNNADGLKEVLDRGMSLTVACESRYNRFKAGHPAGFIEGMANMYKDIGQDLKCFKTTGKNNNKEVFGTSVALEGLAWLEKLCQSVKTKKWEKLK